MTVQKSIDLVATGTSIEDAIRAAVARAGLTVRGVTNFELQRVEGDITEEGLVFRVWVRLWFVVKEPLHE